MKKLIKPTSQNSPIYLYEYQWRITYWVSTGCDGYWARCGLPGSDCNSVVNPTCFPWP